MTMHGSNATPSSVTEAKYRLTKRFLVGSFLGLSVVSYYAAFFLRTGFSIPEDVTAWIWTTLPCVLAAKAVLLIVGLAWAQQAADTTLRVNRLLLEIATVAAVGIYGLNLSLFEIYLYPIPRSVILLDWALSFGFWLMLQAIWVRAGGQVGLESAAEKEARIRAGILTISMGSGGPKVHH